MAYNGGVVLCAVLLAVLLVMTNVLGKNQFSWMKLDRFDEVNDLYRSVTEANCRGRSRAQLTMRSDVVSQLPVYNQLLSRIWYKNRTTLIHIHNMALNRAFFYSYILQKMNTSETFMKQPNWLYFYFSAAADVNANPNTLNGSSLYFDTGCHYPNWYTTVPFNKTLPLFGPKATRWDDFRDQDNRLREPSRRVVRLVDLGAGSNYTNQKFKMNPWYQTWLPDVKGDMDSLTKFSYQVGIRMSNLTGHFIKDTYENYAFFGPSSPGASEQDPRMLPVQWSAPYFDCGGSNKWVVSAVSPVVDFMPRYSNYTHMRRQRIVAVSVMDTDFVSLDYNACGVSAGNPGPSYLSGIHRCRSSTQCKHSPGYGFRRGGYTCVCKAGHRVPWFVEHPFQGADIEQATVDEYKTDFTCSPSNHLQVLPAIDNIPVVQVEGAGHVTSGGGLDANSRGHKKRSVHGRGPQSSPGGLDGECVNETTSKVKLRVKVTGPQTQFCNEGHTIKQHIILADKLRKLRENNKLNESFHEVGVTVVHKHEIGLEGNERMVDVRVETMYQRDLQVYTTLKKMLQNSKNLTSTSSLLRDHIRHIRDRHVSRYHASRTRDTNKRRKRAITFDDQSFDRMMKIFRKKASVTPGNCKNLRNHQLSLPGDVAYGVSTQFESEGRTALRLSHFLSMFLQNVQPDENFGDLRGGGRLYVDQLFGEVLANVMANNKIYAAGLYFDRYKFENENGSRRELFGPWAFRHRGSFRAIDMAGMTSSYVDEDWFARVKARFVANFKNVPVYKIRAHVRSDHKGTSSVRHEYYPLIYRAATYELGSWTSPHFRCDGHVDAWVMTYISPFFGLDPRRSRLEFRGVTTVDVPLDLLEINQCPQPLTVANAFKNTARCDYFSTTCAPLPGLPFMRGSYRCSCKLGFEYWHSDGKTWIHGSLLELEYEKKKAGIFSRFDLLRCRISATTTAQPSILVLLVSIITSLPVTWTVQE